MRPDPREGCAVTTNLIEPGELGRHRADPDWAIIDCRFELARPDWGEQAFAAAHIPNALYAHLDRDLPGPRTALTGPPPLPEVGARVARIASRARTRRSTRSRATSRAPATTPSP